MSAPRTSRLARDPGVDRFDRWAATYDQSFMQRAFFDPVQEATLDALAREVPRPHRLLDVGCGTGRLLRRAGPRFPSAEMVGVDAARGMVREAAGTAPSGFSVRFVEGRVENLPFLSGWFDAVTSTVSFHHWRDQRAGLAEIGRVLAPGAVLALADISPSGAMLVLRPLLRRHGRFPPSAGLDSMLQAAGFASVRRVRVPGMGGAMLVVMARKDPARVRARAPARGRAGSPSGRKALPILGGRDRSG